MAREYNVTTTGTAATVELHTLGKTLTHPVTVDLLLDCRLWEIESCMELWSAFDMGHVTITDEMSRSLYEINSMDVMSYLASTRVSASESFEFAGGISATRQRMNRRSISSDVSPLAPCFDSKINALSFSNGTDSADVDIEVYVNRVLQYTWSVRGKRIAHLSMMPSSHIVVGRGEGVHIEINPVGGGIDPSDCVVTVYYYHTSDMPMDGGAMTF